MFLQFLPFACLRTAASSSQTGAVAIAASAGVVVAVDPKPCMPRSCLARCGKMQHVPKQFTSEDLARTFRKPISQNLGRKSEPGSDPQRARQNRHILLSGTLSSTAS